MLKNILLNQLPLPPEKGNIDWIESGANKLELNAADLIADKSLALLDATPMPSFPDGAPEAPASKKRPSYWVNYYLTWIANVPKPKYDREDREYNKVKWPLEQILLLLKGCYAELRCREPRIHSTIESKLQAHHPLAFAEVRCDFALPGVENLGEWCLDPNKEVEKNLCRKLLHAGNNETIIPWVETGDKNYCMSCFLYANLVVDASEQSFDIFKLTEE
jgi:hypothetical protein